jgi:hypothetical protein
MELLSIFDPSIPSFIDPIYPGVNTSFPNVTFPQTTASTSLPIFSFQSPFGGIGEPDLGFGVQVPRALPLRERYLDSFYRNFYAAHPFIPPKEVLLVLAQGTSLEPLLAAIRWIGSLYIEQDTSPSLFKDASRLIDNNPLKDGFLVQARLLLIIGLDGNRHRKRAEKLMVEARDISIQINLNTDQFATTNGQGIPILEESWRRTWWELYIVDALMSGVHQTDTFALYDVPKNVALPCEEYQFLTGVSRVKKPFIYCMFTRSSKYLPLCTHTTWKISGCSMAGPSHRTPIESNVPASWVFSRGCQHRSTTSTSSSLTGCFAYHLQNMTLIAKAS